VVMISFVGVYSVNHATFDLLVMTAFGVVGYVLRKLDIPVVPVVLGLLLGGDMEQNFRRALSISGGDYSILFGSGIAVGLYVATAILLGVAVVFAIRKRHIPVSPPPVDEPLPQRD
jgi:putative tricarboxylic transport membrane protein